MTHVHAMLIAAVIVGAPRTQDPPRRDEGAAPLYRTALEEARRALEAEDTNGALPIPLELDRVGLEWREAVAKTAVACTLFSQAAALPKCRFRPPTAQQNEYADLAVPLFGLAQLVAAHGKQHATDAPANTIADASALFGNARHAAQQDCLLGIAVASQVEQLAIELLEMVAAAADQNGDKALVRRCLKELERQEIATPSIVRIADIAAADGGDELLASLAECLGRLDGRARQAIERSYGLGGVAATPRDRVAAELGLEPNGLKTLLQRTRHLLRACLERRER